MNLYDFFTFPGIMRLDPIAVQAYLRSCFFLTLVLASGATNATAGKCPGDSAHFHIMPKEIGTANADNRIPFVMPCDSMVVPKGQTTLVHPGAMIHFGPNPSPASKILVLGTLQVNGDSLRPVFFAGSFRKARGEFIPGTQGWDGIEVDSSAAVEFHFTRIYGASTAMTILSRNAFLTDAYFKGASGLILPESGLSLNAAGETIDTLDLRIPLHVKTTLPSEPSKPEHNAPLVKKDSGKMSGKKIALLTGTGASMLAVGAVTWMVLNKKPGTSPPTPVRP